MKGSKVFIIWRTVKGSMGLLNEQESTLVEVHSDIDKAWERHEMLNKGARRKGTVSYSVEVQEVK